MALNCSINEKRNNVVRVQNDNKWANVLVLGEKVVVLDLFEEKHYP